MPRADQDQRRERREGADNTKVKLMISTIKIIAWKNVETVFMNLACHHSFQDNTPSSVRQSNLGGSFAGEEISFFFIIYLRQVRRWKMEENLSRSFLLPCYRG